MKNGLSFFCTNLKLRKLWSDFHNIQFCLTMWQRTWESTTKESDNLVSSMPTWWERKRFQLEPFQPTEQAADRLIWSTEEAPVLYWQLLALISPGEGLHIGPHGRAGGRNQETRQTQCSRTSLSELQGHLREEPILVNTHGQSVQRAHPPTSTDNLKHLWCANHSECQISSL